MIIQKRHWVKLFNSTPRYGVKFVMKEYKLSPEDAVMEYTEWRKLATRDKKTFKEIMSMHDSQTREIDLSDDLANAQIIKLYNEGYTMRELARMVEHSNAYVRKVLADTGTLRPHKNSRIFIHKEEIRELLKQGTLSKDIAKKFDISVSATNAFIRKHKLRGAV